MPSSRVLIAASVALALAVYLLRLNTIAGQYVDDAWYVLLAQAIASGQGYHLISAPTAELAAILPSSPPGFAMVLALVMALTPAFPSNVVFLKMVSIAAMLGVGAVAFLYYRGRSLPPLMAGAVALLVVLTPAFVWLATSTVMSEPLFTLAQLSAIVLIARRRPVLGGAVAAGAILIRSAALPILVAAVIWYLVRREGRAALLFAAAACVVLLPWAIYARANATPLDVRLGHGGAHVFTYQEQFMMRRAGEIQSGEIALSDLPARIGNQLVNVFGRDIGAIVVPELYRPAIESGEETLSVGGTRGTLSMGSMGNTRGTMLVSFVLGALALLGAVNRWRHGPDVSDYFVPLALVPILLFPHWSFRLVLPLAPFLFGYLVAGVQTLSSAWPRIVRVALACLLSLHLIDHAMYRAQVEHAVWVQDAREVAEVLDWMQRELTARGHVASTNPALVYLHTGRRGVAIDDARGRWEAWRAMGVRYVVSLQPGELPPASLPYRVLHQTARSGLWVVEMTD